MSKLNPLVGGDACVCSAVNRSARRKALLFLSSITAAGLSVGLVAQDSGLEVYESYSMTGQGESRATNTLNAEALEIAMPGATPEKLIDKMPGVNVVSTDPFGFYEFGNDVRIRAFDISKIGVTVDGVPLGTSSPRYGTPINRLINPSNVEAIKVSQGAGDVSIPAYQALGGSIEYFSVDPSDEAGGLMSIAYGSFDNVTLFGRYELGEFAPGFTGYVSVGDFSFTPKGLDGLGKGRGRHFATKFKYESADEKLKILFGYTYNDRDDFDTASISYGEWQGLQEGNYNGTGQGWIEYTPWDFPGIGSFNYGDFSDEGRNLGPIKYLDPNAGPGESTNAVLYDKWKNGRMDQLAYANIEVDLDEGKSFSVVPYYQDKNNYGLWGRDAAYSRARIREAYSYDLSRDDIWADLWYDAAGNAIGEDYSIVEPFSETHAVVLPGSVYTAGDDFEDFKAVTGRTARDENFGGHRYGLTAEFEWETDNNLLTVGGWFEYDYHSTERPNYNLDGGSIFGEFLYDQVNFLNYSRYIDQDVIQLWVQDAYKAMDGDLQLIAGVKFIDISRDATGFLTFSEWAQNTPTSRSTSYKDSFLPQFGAIYALTDNMEGFFNWSENMAAPDAGTITTAGDTFDPNLLNPEYSENIDFGIRGTVGALDYTLQGYSISYTDRILSVPVPIDSPDAGAAGNTRYQNVGGVDSTGVEFSGEYTTAIDGLKLSGSIALQSTKFQENLLEGFETFASPDDIPDDPNYVYEETSIAGTYNRYKAIADNDLGNSPGITASIDAIYKTGQWRFNFGGKFYDDVYINVFNTQVVDAYTVFDAGVGYYGKEGTAAEGWSTSLSIYNVFDEYFWYAGSYTGDSGSVRADRGRQFTLKVESKF